MPEKQKFEVKRWKVGAIAVALLLGAAYVWLVYPEKSTLLAGLVRVGCLMSAIWLAMPAGDREAAWANVNGTTLIGFGLVVFAIANPRRGLALMPLVAVLGVLNYFSRPDSKRPSAGKK